MVDLAATGFEAGGTLAMALGTVVAVIQVIAGPARPGRDVVLEFRQRLGRAIVLGLELLVAADILRTVSMKPTLQEVAVLGSSWRSGLPQLLARGRTEGSLALARDPAPAEELS